MNPGSFPVFPAAAAPGEVTTTIDADRIDRWARRLVRAGVGRTALFLVVSHLPLSNIALHATLVLDPFLRALCGPRAEQIQELLSDRANLELLAQRIEAHLDAPAVPTDATVPTDVAVPTDADDTGDRHG